MKKLLGVLGLISVSALAANLEIDLEHEISLGDGFYVAQEYEGQGRFALISHDHGRFEGDKIMVAECSDGFIVHNLPAKYAEIQKVLRPDDYLLTFCKEYLPNDD